MSDILIRIADILAFPCRIFARLAGLMLFVLTGVIMYDVIGRQFFDTGSVFLVELEWHMHGLIVMLAFGYAFLKDGHVRIDVFSGSFPRRTRIWIDMFAILFFLTPFCAAMIWFGWDYVGRAYDRGTGSPIGGLPHRFIVFSLVPLAGVMTLLGGYAVFLRCIVSLMDPERYPTPFERDPVDLSDGPDMAARS